MKTELKNIKQILKQYGQEHLLLKYDEMDENGKSELLNQINNIDFDLMKDLYEKAQKPVKHDDVTIEPIEHVDKSKLTAAEKEYEALADEESKLNCTVWLTKTGDCYHIEGCRFLRSKYESLTQREAIERGYAACSECITSYWLPKRQTNSN